ncbi:hypothetical protein BAUCODRAFT_72421 [Baudoinia panamericana UAMH 10762]|uniref:DNA mismatch repair proteins mutS family domain-containing protein n=1 Tax=Baudoinia panamericana (strain UAMH 10762) TaxID=717646 RepID=M2N7R7_BAUPA|nr:uncharacterized protein BAUCODRAFT_72421 [Baudoinia panamericana UAMH 10762]EMC95114.1 hypothetical protein BAUCODRAFT_72421 [Baudoinia panamericana UAMH 10762]
MSLQSARCTIRSLRSSWRACIKTRTALPCLTRGGLPAFGKFWTRGVKTRTVVKASSLPQGVLPALPPDEDDDTTASYPTMLQQHLNNIRKHPDCVVLTRVGDFYEMYFDQVAQFAPLVNLKQAKKMTALGPVPMAGFQHTQLERYLKMFVMDHGKQVALIEQVPLSNAERSLRPGGPQYDRQLKRVFTAGTLIDENFVDPYENNYLLAVHIDGEVPVGSKPSDRGQVYERYRRSTRVGLSWVDLSSGDFFTQASDLATLPSIVSRVMPREIILPEGLSDVGPSRLQGLLGEGNYSLHFYRSAQIHSTTTVESWTPMLERATPEKQAEAFAPCEIAAGSLVLGYVRERLVDLQIQLQPPVRRSDDDYMAIDKQSLRGLEIRSTLRDGTFQGSLLHAVRHTVTKSGSRLLSQRLVSPSMSLSVINDRLDLVQEMLEQDALREDVVVLLRRTADALRLLQRFSIGKGDADDLLNLARTIGVTSEMAQLVRDHIVSREDSIPTAGHKKHPPPNELGFLRDIHQRFDLDGPAKVAKAIEEAIDEEGLNQQHVAEAESQAKVEIMAEEVESADAAGEPGPKLGRRAAKTRAVADAADSISNDIWIMRNDASPTLGRAHSDLESLLKRKNQLTQRLRKQLKAESLNLRWTSNLGHHCHVKGKDTRTDLAALAGARAIGSTKSTRSFYLADWTHLGTLLEDSKMRIRMEEERVFNKLRAQVLESLMKLRRNAAVLDELDVACSSATIAKERDLIRPLLNTGTSHNVIGGRHPTVAVGLKDRGRLFTANNCGVGDREKIYLITGPNMAGKSTYLRQNALVTILAQTGCFVPADYAEIGLVDRIFSRVGSADNLYQDQSTFMVEMLETAEILKQATPRSFVIMDEVGRGTTPEDGIAVGYACLHALHNVNKCRTLFATHFHALADMTRDFDHLACYCTDVAEDADGSWTYLHKLRKGVNRESHALKVARLAGLPTSAIHIAEQVLRDLRKERERAEQELNGGQRILLTAAG